MGRPDRINLSPESLLARGIPKQLIDKDVKDFEDFGIDDLKNVRSFVSEYCKHLTDRYIDNHGVFLQGSNGVGKSLIACVIIKEAFKKRYSCRRVTFVEYIREYTRVWGVDKEEDKAELEAIFYDNYKALEFLVLEEVGKEISTKVSTPILEDLLRYREEKGLPTIICTNVKIDDMEKRYGESVVSLILYPAHTQALLQHGS